MKCPRCREEGSQMTGTKVYWPAPFGREMLTKVCVICLAEIYSKDPIYTLA